VALGGFTAMTLQMPGIGNLVVACAKNLSTTARFQQNPMESR
jgi:hypothetical protein